ncbi:hypothetical protein LEN26_007628 [Aphanomyces euteiches]|nr:hypothetical protein AeMF1_009214 [Aphanomyces euteiches]KAH9131706.1 hypothetical protein LEN26_007628 [Aphanomyces euteiches]KAH9194180.1 hypothetical protein AeNC1_003831 [Aphanomyces euteiches]
MDLDMNRLDMDSVDRQFGIESSHLMQAYYTNVGVDLQVHVKESPPRLSRRALPCPPSTEIPTQQIPNDTWPQTQRGQRQVAPRAVSRPVSASATSFSSSLLPLIDTRVETQSGGLKPDQLRVLTRPQTPKAATLCRRQCVDTNQTDFWSSSHRISTRARRKDPIVPQRQPRMQTPSSDNKTTDGNIKSTAPRPPAIRIPHLATFASTTASPSTALPTTAISIERPEVDIEKSATTSRRSAPDGVHIDHDKVVCAKQLSSMPRTESPMDIATDLSSFMARMQECSNKMTRRVKCMDAYMRQQPPRAIKSPECQRCLWLARVVQTLQLVEVFPAAETPHD